QKPKYQGGSTNQEARSPSHPGSRPDLPTAALAISGFVSPILPFLIRGILALHQRGWFASRARVVVALFLGSIGLLALSALWLARQSAHENTARQTDANNLEQISSSRNARVATLRLHLAEYTGLAPLPLAEEGPFSFRRKVVAIDRREHDIDEL